MDTRFKIKEIRRFFKNLSLDYRSGVGPSKKQKRSSYFRMTYLLFTNVWNGISAPFVYPIWYLFRKSITDKIYRNTSWQEINKMIDENRTVEVKEILKNNGGNLLYWLWTYGDLRDPLGAGELTGQPIKNNFWNRFKENAIRNVRFTTQFYGV
jgi:hypothetical protein